MNCVHNGQQGAALLLSMLMLLALMTLAGVSSMSGAGLQLRMVANQQARHQALAAAEAAITRARRNLDDIEADQWLRLTLGDGVASARFIVTFHAYRERPEAGPVPVYRVLAHGQAERARQSLEVLLIRKEDAVRVLHWRPG